MPVSDLGGLGTTPGLPMPVSGLEGLGTTPALSIPPHLLAGPLFTAGLDIGLTTSALEVDGGTFLPSVLNSYQPNMDFMRYLHLMEMPALTTRVLPPVITSQKVTVSYFIDNFICVINVLYIDNLSVHVKSD